MSKNNRIKVFLLLGVMLVSITLSGCTPEQPTEPSKTEPGLNTVAFSEIIDANNIEKIVINLQIYSSVRLNIDNQSDLQTVLGILDSDKEQIDSSFDYSLNDVNYFIDLICKDKVISIEAISSNNNIYYIVEDRIYKCSKSDHILLERFILEKISEERPDSVLDYIAK